MSKKATNTFKREPQKLPVTKPGRERNMLDEARKDGAHAIKMMDAAARKGLA